MLSGTAPIKTYLILKGSRKDECRRIKNNLEERRVTSTYTRMGLFSHSWEIGYKPNVDLCRKRLLPLGRNNTCHIIPT